MAPMATTPQPSYRLRDMRVSRFLQARWRFVFAVILGLALGAVLPNSYHLTSRFLIGFDAGVALYLLLVVVMILRSDPDRVRRESPLQDDGRVAIPILTVAAGMTSLIAIVFWLRTASQSENIQPGLLALLFVTTLLSWLFIHTMFALHYAHEYYAEHRGAGGGMRFPGGDKPGYWDFVYFAFVIGTSTAVSDVAVTSATIRKTVTTHGLVAFVFNVTMIALTVSIAGDAISIK
ncbi:hypothetical protein AUC69_01845 [Methyloceanibacter superfactus]|uniref:DUF1345 domain-containing protein n=2 Tax=Methyloceanibacter superfactus TaxID=1774969 RepID=A0A1E3VSR0_9HYPH|nr:hypothetical protein AUC69_01845 [Methyloceanibacter superfactus]